jgi:hypothetical protein
MGILWFLLWMVEPPAYIRPVTLIQEFWVVVDENYDLARQLKARDVFEIPSGARIIRFIHPRHSDQVFPVTVSEGDTLTLSFSMPPLQVDRSGSSSSFLRFTTGGNVLFNTDHDTAVLLGTDTLRVGAGYVVLPNKQRHSVILISSFGHEIVVEIDLTKRPIQAFDTYLRPDRRWSLMVAWVPGATALYQREYAKSVVYGVGGAVSLALAQRWFQRADDRMAAYDVAVRRYELAGTMQAAILAREEALRIRSLADNAARNRDLHLVIAAGVLLINAVDSFIPPRSGYRDDLNRIRFVTHPNEVGVRIRIP